MSNDKREAAYYYGGRGGREQIRATDERSVLIRHWKRELRDAVWYTAIAIGPLAFALGVLAGMAVNP